MQPAGAAPASAAQPPAGAASQSQAAAVAGQVAGQGLAITKNVAGKGLTMVKEMDAGTLGMVMKGANLITGAVLMCYSGVSVVLTQMASFTCDLTSEADMTYPDCCLTPPVPGGTCTSHKGLIGGGNFAVFVIAVYMILFGFLLFIYELSTKRSGADVGGGDFGSGLIGSRVNSLRSFLTRYFGFIFFYKKRMHFLLFVGMMCAGNINNPNEDWDNRNWEPPVVGGICAFLNGFFHFVIRLQHPEFDKGMQDQMSAANELDSGANQEAGTSAPAYQSQVPSYNTGAAASSTGGYPPPAGGNIYASSQPADDGGTAI